MRHDLEELEDVFARVHDQYQGDGAHFFGNLVFLNFSGILDGVEDGHDVEQYGANERMRPRVVNTLLVDPV